METPLQTCTRLLTALEELSAQEAACMEARDFASVAKIQARAAPLVTHLGEHGPSVADAAFRARLAEWLARRQQTGEWLAAQIAQAKSELDRVSGARGRLVRFAPVYRGKTAPQPKRLRAVG